MLISAIFRTPGADPWRGLNRPSPSADQSRTRDRDPYRVT